MKNRAKIFVLRYSESDHTVAPFLAGYPDTRIRDAPACHVLSFPLRPGRRGPGGHGRRLQPADRDTRQHGGCGRLAKIEPGRTPQSEVLALLGSPSSQANFGEPTWYYIGQLTERQAFYRPETIERRVVYVDFEPAGTVKSIGTLDLEDGKKIAIVDRETPTAGQRITLLKQLIGNVGRFSPTD